MPVPRTTLVLVLVLSLLPLCEFTRAQVAIDPGDPPNPADIPEFYGSTLPAIDRELKQVEKGEIKIIAYSPGGWPVYAICYGEKDNLHSQANYNSAVAAGNPGFYARKEPGTRPVIFFLGPVHGQEVEGIAGLLNLIHVAETGRDKRGQEWPSLKEKMERCRIIIVPCGNPDGRNRCPYNSFVGLPVEIMTKYGQGTRRDGTSWGWPGAKSLHPMKGNVGILGAYFNDDGINMMHDDFFAPMAAETEAILNVARMEAPDMTVSLHSHHQRSRILPAYYVPGYMKMRIDTLARLVNRRFTGEGVPGIPDDWIREPGLEDATYPPQTSFNLVSALHHVSGTMAFTFECCHGTITRDEPEPGVSYDDILDIQLNLYDVMLDYILKNRLYVR